MVFFLFGRPFRDLQESVPSFFSHGVLSIFCLEYIPGTQMGPLVLIGISAFFWRVKKIPKNKGQRGGKVYRLYYSHSYIPIGSMYGIFTYIYHKLKPLILNTIFHGKPRFTFPSFLGVMGTHMFRPQKPSFFIIFPWVFGCPEVVWYKVFYIPRIMSYYTTSSYNWPNEIIFHQPGFSWNKGSHFPSKKLPFGISLGWGRYNLAKGDGGEIPETSGRKISRWICRGWRHGELLVVWPRPVFF